VGALPANVLPLARTVALLSVLAALVLGGCGDEGGGDDLDADELISRGDALCGEGQERFAEIQVRQPRNPKDAAAQADELIGVAAEELNELRSLRPPEELIDPLDEYLAARDAALELLEDGRDAAADRDAEGYGKAQAELAAGAKERRRLARAVGFEVCSQPPRPAREGPRP
jgi:hypothetical protein